jgi:protein phosphatase
MTTSRPETVAAPARKPLDEEVDVFGMTHSGKVRSINQDHFLICSLRKRMEVHLTSLPDVSEITSASERLAFIAVVADGVGGGAGGEEASRLAIQEVSHYVTNSMQCYYSADPGKEHEFVEALHDAAMRSHVALVDKAAREPDRRGMATTLTLWLGVWPSVYILQVGDSRCYILEGETLTQITRDQTMAEELIEQGVLPRSKAFQTRWAHVLSSSLGGQQTAPVVTRFDFGWGRVGMLCSDGLTKHVSDEQIKHRLQTMTSARQACRALIDDALEGGGSDNITVIVGRTVDREGRGEG